MTSTRQSFISTNCRFVRLLYQISGFDPCFNHYNIIHKMLTIRRRMHVAAYIRDRLCKCIPMALSEVIYKMILYYYKTPKLHVPQGTDSKKIHAPNGVVNNECLNNWWRFQTYCHKVIKGTTPVSQTNSLYKMSQIIFTHVHWDVKSPLAFRRVLLRPLTNRRLNTGFSYYLSPTGSWM